MKKLRKSDLLTNWYWFSIFYVKQLFIMWFTVLEYVDLDSNAKTTTFCIRCTLIPESATEKCPFFSSFFDHFLCFECLSIILSKFTHQPAELGFVRHLFYYCWSDGIQCLPWVSFTSIPIRHWRPLHINIHI